MKAHRVEQHMISKSSEVWKLIDTMCLKSKNLYNYANYLIRQKFIGEKKYIKYNDLAAIVKTSEPYRDLGSNVGQQILKVLDQNWKAFLVSINDWTKNKEKYLGKPNMPNYLDKEKGRFPLIIDNIKFKIVGGMIRFSWKPLSPLNNKFSTHVLGKLLQVRFVNKGCNYVMEIVYEIDVPDQIKYTKNIASIDLGVNNLATVSNNFKQKPFYINGRPLKSINQYYNQKKASVQSQLKIKNDMNWSNKLQQLTDKRANKVKDYLHKSSKYIIDWCVYNNVDTLVVGINKRWKQNSCMSKLSNQNFISVPFDVFISQLKYKSENVGIKFIEVEESYTSGTSFIDKELPTKTNYKKSRRVCRGLFVADMGVKINSDLNASYQIMKKVFPNVFDDGIEGVGFHPVRINIL